MSRPVGARGGGGRQILSGQLTLSQLGVTDYAHLITTGFLDLPTAHLMNLSKHAFDKLGTKIFMGLRCK